MYPKPVGGVLENIPFVGGVNVSHDRLDRPRLAIDLGRYFRPHFQFPLAKPKPPAITAVQPEIVAQGKQGESGVGRTGLPKER